MVGRQLDLKGPKHAMVLGPNFIINFGQYASPKKTYLKAIESAN